MHTAKCNSYKMSILTHTYKYAWKKLLLLKIKKHLLSYLSSPIKIVYGGETTSQKKINKRHW